jgi:hypothetical protein
MFQPTDGTIHTWDNTKMYTKKGDVKMKEAPYLQAWKTLAFLSIYFCVVSDDRPFRGLKHMSEFCR